MSKQKLFSLTRKDFELQTFRSGGPGGQHQNKRDTGVRIKHGESGAVGESRSERSQYTNRKAAFERLVDTEAFQKWIRIEAARKNKSKVDIEEYVRQTTRPWNLKVEVMKDGEWVEE